VNFEISPFRNFKPI